MLITHFVESLERGGLERVVVDLAQAQAEAGNECRVICLFTEGVLAQALAARGIEVVSCGKRRGADVAALLRARAAMRRRPGGILHTHNATAHYHAIAAGTGRRFDAIVNTRHGMGDIDPSSRRERLYRHALRRTDSVVAVCEAARTRLANSGAAARRALHVIPNGIRTERFAVSSPEARAGMTQALGLSDAARIVGTVGRLHPAKDQAGLIRAFAIVRKAMPEGILVIVGDGALREELETVARETGVADAVRFLGDRDDIDRLLPGFDVFALPSLTEGYSVALVEACASALPVVATDVGGNGEIIRHGDNGLLVPARDGGALAAALLMLLRDQGLAASMGRAGRKWALAEGSLQAMVARYAALYEGRAT